MKRTAKTSPEYQALTDLAKRVLSVPRAELQRRLEAENAAKAARRVEREKTAKRSP